MFEKEVENYKDEIINTASRLIQIPSVYEKSDNPQMPFGKEADNALKYMLSLGERLGFNTKNVDGYCGYIEFGDGNEMLGIVGHLDVVPVGNDWTYPPFSGVVRGGKIYGRGAIDDKGPMVASLYAMKAVMDSGAKLHKKVRLILGLNEETNWKCIDYYKKHEELPSIGFSPDAEFPCIYAEKGFLSIYLKQDYTKNLNAPLAIKEIVCDNAINVVPKICEVTISVNSSKINIDTLITYIEAQIQSYSFEIKAEKLDNSNIKLTSFGLAAHAAHPELGKNAVSPLVVLLNNVFSYCKSDIPIFHLFSNYINTEYSGSKLGLDVTDESGALTVNVGKFDYKNDSIEIGLNIRIPINTDLEVVKNKFTEIVSKYTNISFYVTDEKQALCVPKDSFLIQTLCKIFEDATGLDSTPIAIGGATFARAFENCVSFGANFPDHEDMCHQADEYVEIHNLILASKMYANAIYELAK